MEVALSNKYFGEPIYFINSISELFITVGKLYIPFLIIGILVLIYGK